MSRERRRYARVETNLRGWARRLDSGQAPPLFNECTLPSTRGEGALLQSSSLHEGVVAFLGELSNKLDTLISLVTRDRLENDFPLRVDILNVSGAGILFQCDEEFALNDHLEIVLILNQLPLRMAGAIGQITRIDSRETGPAYALLFTRIREPDQETVVQFVFQEERYKIRQQRRET